MTPIGTARMSRYLEFNTKWYPTRTPNMQDYRAGQLDMTDTVPANAIPALRRDHAKELLIAPYLATAFYGLNLSMPLLGQNLKLRQALAMSIDRNRLVAALGFGQTGAYGFVPPGTWNYSPQSWDWKDLSDVDRIAQAQRLYAEAGFSRQSALHVRLLLTPIRSSAIRRLSLRVCGTKHSE